jgi:hypothetical protein
MKIDKKIVLDRFSKTLVFIGILTFLTYLPVRMYAISHGGGAEFYGTGFYTSERALIMILLSSTLVVFGCILFYFNKNSSKMD